MSRIKVTPTTEHVTIGIPQGSMVTKQARNIMSTELVHWMGLFLAKNKQYAELAEATLGDRAMFVDVWRKVNALKLLIWEGKDAGTEPTDEIILDLIGHLFLMLEYRHREKISVVDDIAFGSITRGRLSAAEQLHDE